MLQQLDKILAGTNGLAKKDLLLQDNTQPYNQWVQLARVLIWGLNINGSLTILQVQESMIIQEQMNLLNQNKNLHLLAKILADIDGREKKEVHLLANMQTTKNQWVLIAKM